MLKAVIFDMDGVIIESEPLHHYAYHKMFNDVNVEVSDTLYETFTGKSTINVCKQVCELFSLKETPEYLVSLKRKHFDAVFNNNVDFDLIEGVLNLIKDLHSNGVTLVLGSSATMPSIERIFNRFDLNPYFIGKLSGADLKQSKPHPEIFINAVKLSGFKPEECMVIEDSTNGILAAKGAGVFCIGFDSFHSKNQDYSKADLVIKKFEEISFDKIKTLL
ncbi:HAD-IA family hydrolase [Mariniflexile litorale]|uniref:HAD-IA family hydrolase n=1 Tax=Mariniflexile litorale TaxID=3045158 RepID=A0AAU7EFS3_9FLAO|nr:HAD-IA family hydrolase [Mariniflexile sp. KMM 9835]MDQ8211797.1 HAD-IA family hydrolase [Mariniflexile sp. KMM 9835]